jgi:glycosyltransferase involved in cell wall biosynthesis
MRILFLVYAQQKSFGEFCNQPKTRFSWVDALIDRLSKVGNTNNGIVVPTYDKSFQKAGKDEIALYGLPNPPEKRLFKKIYNSLTYREENLNINNYTLQAVSDFKPDIIQIFGSENPFGLIIKNLNIPVIIHIQGYLLVWKVKWFTAISRWEQFRYESLKNLLIMQGSYHEYNIFMKRAAREAIILKNCRYFMGRTDFDKKIISLLSPDSIYFHCEEFIRKDFFERSWNFPLGGLVKCVSILKATSYKGIELLVETSLILKEYSAFPVEFSICGVSEEEEIIAIIKKKYRKETDLSNVRFLGRLSSPELVDQLCSSNFYVHPSYIENSPNSVCEAMALGMPVISTNVGGINSMITDKTEGLLVQEGEPYSLAAAIVELINNYEAAKLLGINARARSLKRNDPEKIMTQLLNIYNTILSENG